MKTTLKRLLRKRNLYYPIKYSPFFRFYQLLFKAAEIKEQKKETAFYKSFLPTCKLIFDIGAYDGHKTEAFLSISEKVISCEPDAENFKLLQTRFRNNKRRVTLENKALSDKEGYAELHVHHSGSAFNTLSNKWMKLLESDNLERWKEQISFTGTQTVETITLDQLINKYGVPDFIKIDAEGSDQRILKGLSQRVHYLSFEILLPDYANEMQDCLAHISSLDNTATYNISRFEKMVLPGFVNKDELEEYLENNNILSFDVIAKMSS
jgi:FkbM family methyltransferase